MFGGNVYRGCFGMNQQADWLSARDLKRQVREAARRKKAEEERAKRQSLSSSIETAAVKVEELEQASGRRWRDYLLPLSAIAVVLALAGGLAVIFHLARVYGTAHQSAWAEVNAKPEELMAVEEYARQMILKAQTGKLADELFHPEIAPYWREKTQRILTELAQSRGVIEDVAVERRQGQEDHRYSVYCRSDQGAGAKLILSGRPGKLLILKANKTW